MIGFRPTTYDEQILARVTRESETTSDAIRRALRLLDQDEWLRQFYIDAKKLKDEDLSTEPDAW